MFSNFKKLFDPTYATIKAAKPVVDKINLLENQVSEMSFEEMRLRVDQMRIELNPLISQIPEENRIPLKAQNFRDSKIEVEIHTKLQEYLPEIFAFVREINRRKFNKRHFDVQLLAGVILAQGNKLTEIKTGEGKTQIFHLPSALYAITARGSHVITVNDYLARRDGEHAGHALSDLGITVGVITPQAAYKFVPDDQLKAVKGEEAYNERQSINVSSMSDMHGVNLVQCSKLEAYSQNIVYGTNNEFGFDYLRDNMSFTVAERVQKELYYCIIDEADSILIDEARTPLIISAPAEKSNQLYEKFARIVEQLDENKHYIINEKDRATTLTDEGVVKVEKLLGVKNIWEDYRYAHHLDNALKALTLFKKDDEYIVNNGEILIVDEFTGRVLPGRRYSEGLHQAIEAKERVEIKKESKTLATITFQNFFKLYKIIGGASGTIITEAEEFQKIYNLESYVIPTNVTVQRIDKTDKIYKDRLHKFNAVANEIIEIHKTGQPILVGTTTIEDSEYLSNLIDKKGVEHEVLNAKFHEREASIVAKAGQKGSVTVATNMAGRGTDIPLGEGVKELGGLYVIGTERHDARRIDNQLRGRSGRQGDPGASQFFVALDDEIMRIQGGEIVKKIMEMTKLPPDVPLESPFISKSIENAQKKMEGYHFDVRKRVVDYDNVMNQQREVFYTKRLNLLTDETLEQAKEKATNTLSTYITSLVDNSYDESSKFNKEKLIAELKDGFGNEFVSDELSIIIDENIDNLDDAVIKISEFLVNKKINEIGENFKDLNKIVALQTLDELWTEHLESISDLREGIGLRGYAQRDPLIEYKNESFNLFERFIYTVNKEISKRLIHVKRVTNPTNTGDIQITNEAQISDIVTGNRELPSNTKIPAQIQASLPNKNVVGRNDLCPCGSGLKYKKCGLINSTKHKV